MRRPGKNPAKRRAWLIALCALGLAATRCGNKSGDISALVKPKPKTYKAVVVDSALPADTLLVATLNMSVGFPVAHLLFKDMANDTIAYKELTELYQRFLKGNPKGRVREMARAIVAEKPDLVGLQEVVVLEVSDILISDFLGELLQAIKDMGGPAYFPLATVYNDTLLRGRKGGDSIVLFFQEGNTLLAKPGMTVLDSGRFTYFSLLPIPIEGAGDTERGFNYLRLKTPKGIEFQAFNTHLEVVENYRNSQAKELMRLADSLAVAESLVVEDTLHLRYRAQLILGDFNDEPGIGSHRVATEAGFKDIFPSNPRDTGYTCCLAGSALWKPDTAFSNRRIDYIFGRYGAGGLENWTALMAPYADSSGNKFLASDHRMVFARLFIP